MNDGVDLRSLQYLMAHQQGKGGQQILIQPHSSHKAHQTCPFLKQGKPALISIRKFVGAKATFLPQTGLYSHSLT